MRARAGFSAARGRGRNPGPDTKIAIIASLEAADPLQGDVDNLELFYEAGVRLITLAWGDNAFLGSTYGPGTGLTDIGADLVEACEEMHVLVDVSHASDQAFADICKVAKRPFAASHGNCRSLCPNPRNLTDEMIRMLAERGGVMGIALAPSFLARDFYEAERPLEPGLLRRSPRGTGSFEDAGRKCAAATVLLPPPPVDLIVQHVLHAIKVGGEDAVGLGGDLDGIDLLPAGFEGVERLSAHRRPAAEGRAERQPAGEDLLRQFPAPFQGGPPVSDATSSQSSGAGAPVPATAGVCGLYCDACTLYIATPRGAGAHTRAGGALEGERRQDALRRLPGREARTLLHAVRDVEVRS